MSGNDILKEETDDVQQHISISRTSWKYFYAKSKENSWCDKKRKRWVWDGRTVRTSTGFTLHSI